MRAVFQDTLLAIAVTSLVVPVYTQSTPPQESCACRDCPGFQHRVWQTDESLFLPPDPDDEAVYALDQFTLLLTGIVARVVALILCKKIECLLDKWWQLAWTSQYNENSNRVNLSSCINLEGPIAIDKYNAEILLNVAEDFLENAERCRVEGGQWERSADGETYECRKHIMRVLPLKTGGEYDTFSIKLFERNVSG